MSTGDRASVSVDRTTTAVCQVTMSFGLRVRGKRAAIARGEVLGQPQRFLPKPEVHDAHTRTEDPFEPIEGVIVKLAVGDLLEGEHIVEERDRAIHVGDGYADGADGERLEVGGGRL